MFFCKHQNNKMSSLDILGFNPSMKHNPSEFQSSLNPWCSFTGSFMASQGEGQEDAAKG
jgi:hypothetical protein